MKAINTLSLVAIALAATTFLACSNDNLTIENNPTKQDKIVTLTATLSPKGGTNTKALTDPGNGTLTSTWTVNEEIEVQYEKSTDPADNPSGSAKATVTAVDGSGKATITVDLVDPKDGNTGIYFHYPYSLATGTKDLKRDQIGTLDDIAANFDEVKGDGVLSVSGGVATLPTNVPMTRNVSILKLAFTNGGSPLIDITALNIKVGIMEIDVNPAIPLDEVYVAINSCSGQEITISAATTTGTYSYSKAGVNLVNGKFYRSTVAMTTAAASGTYREYSNRTNFDNVAIPGGATTVTSGTTTWVAGTYVVSGDVTIDGNVSVTGDAKLILKDGASLTVNGKIQGDNLSIYGQALSSGKLDVVYNDISVSVENLAIHGGVITVTEGGVMQGLESYGNLDIYHGNVTTAGDANGFMVLGDMHVYGGNVTCSAVHGGALSIYGAGTPGSLTVSGGTFTATAAGVGNCGIYATDGSGDGTASIVFTGGTIVVSGGASDNSNPGGHAIDVCGILTISGNANVTANGGTDAFGTGGGYGIKVRAGSSAGGNATISGGTVTATSGPGGMAAINTDGNLTISGATTQIDATGGDMGEGILAGGTITINGGNITATAGENAIGLEGNTTISGGIVTAIGGDAAASSDGDGRAGYDGALTMNGGKLIATGGAKDGTGDDGLGISGGSTIALTGVTMYESDTANPATPAASQTACTKRYVIIH